MKINIWLGLLFQLVVAQANCDQASIYFKSALQNKKNNLLAEAKADLQQSVALCPQFNSHYQLGKMNAQQDNWQQALIHFKQARKLSIKASKYELKALVALASIYLYLDNLQQARLYIEMAYAINKDASPQRVLALRQRVDEKLAHSVVSAEEIQLVMSSAKGAGAVPRMEFNAITFNLASAELTQQGHRQVLEIARFLKAHTRNVLLTGHTDKQGDTAYNFQLSIRRAAMVKQALQLKNPDLLGRIQVQGKGEQELKYPGNNETVHHLNRRVEMQLL